LHQGPKALDDYKRTIIAKKLLKELENPNIISAEKIFEMRQKEILEF
jgi:hypothetical protein